MNGINTIAVKNSKMIEDMLVRTSSLCVCVCVFILPCRWSNMLDTRERDGKRRKCDEPGNAHKRMEICFHTLLPNQQQQIQNATNTECRHR